MAYSREYYLLNREKAIARQKKWNEKNKQLVMAYLAYWKVKNPDKVAEYEENRRSGKTIMTRMIKEQEIKDEVQRLLVQEHQERMAEEVAKIERKEAFLAAKNSKRRMKYHTDEQRAQALRDASSRYREKNIDTIREKYKKYRIENKEAICQRKRERYAAAKLNKVVTTNEPDSSSQG